MSERRQHVYTNQNPRELCSCLPVVSTVKYNCSLLRLIVPPGAGDHTVHPYVCVDVQLVTREFFAKLHAKCKKLNFPVQPHALSSSVGYCLFTHSHTYGTYTHINTLSDYRGI